MTRSVAPRLRLFLNQMYLKLRENDHKGDWRLELGIPELWELLEDEIEELAQAINSNLGSQEIVRECADVANFAMMIADVAGGLVEDKSPVSSEAPTRVDWQAPSYREPPLFPTPEETAASVATLEQDEPTSKIFR